MGRSTGLKKKPVWLDVTKDLPIDVEVGQVLTFDFEGSKTYLKIMRIYKDKVWAKEIDKLLTPSEFLEKYVQD